MILGSWDSFIGTFQLWPASALTLWKVNVSVGIQLDPKSDTAIFLRVGQRHSAVHLGMLLVAQAGPKTKECEQRWEKVAVCNSEHLVLSLNAIGGIP